MFIFYFFGYDYVKKCKSKKSFFEYVSQLKEVYLEYYISFLNNFPISRSFNYIFQFCGESLQEKYVYRGSKKKEIRNFTKTNGSIL